jgi:DNA-binding cell septation regulator SpoVG
MATINGIEVTCRIFPAKGDGHIKAYASLTFGGIFVVSGLKVMEGKNGLFVAMPSYDTKQVDDAGKKIYKDSAFPLTAEARKEITMLILSAYSDME